MAIFVTVYLGMILGGLPRLKLDRSGVALIGAIAILGLGAMRTEQAVGAVDWPTVLLLFSFMVLSAQMHLSGFYTAVTRLMTTLPLTPNTLLGALIAVAAGLSAVFSNDIICLALTPMVAQLCLQRGLNPVPFLLGLACAANIGSAATLIGNPQNMLIGTVLHLPFGAYLRHSLPPTALSLLGLWAWLVWGPGTGMRPKQANEPNRLRESPPAQPLPGPPFDAWQTSKGLLVAGALMGVFLFTDLPREVAALVGAAVLLLSRRRHSSHVMGLVDWPLLVLFVGLFVVNHAFESTGLAAQAVAWLATQGVHLADPGPLLVASVGLSNLVSNVPAVMLLLPHLKGMESGLTLALVSTFAGNLLLVGSIANLIVVDLAQRNGITIDWRLHARVGVPVTILSLGVVWVWLRWH
ncbi:anion transporter [Rhodoferax sp.]|uniref:anion transporter n=1 Tax=Rhodoferax sp. TaxID=50421 RepID=UPI0028451194|nr:anion transporter [Rhodoferax sp.]MDR3371830.1 anion transporter [Rhodoferax sp.]